jgi:hypothetical protein
MNRPGKIAQVLLIFSLLSLIGVWTAGAYPSFFDSRCSSCHSNDTPTCDGCHEHRNTVSAAINVDTVPPGDPIVITMNGGSQGGWIRGLLYDENDNLIMDLGGPTGTGDDGAGDPVTFPVQFATSAPLIEGDYIWEVAWFGGNEAGTSHFEQRAPVTVSVRGVPTGIDIGDDVIDGRLHRTWQELKGLY